MGVAYFYDVQPTEKRRIVLDSDEINEQLHDVSHAKLFFTDINGKLMNLSVNKTKLLDIIQDGVGFDGSSIAGYATVEHSDRLLVPDPATFTKLTIGEEKIAF